MADPESFADCWFLSGTTASGKTEVGLELARLLDAEIVSMDSMALYRGMDIGTAKPSSSQRALVAHHLIDVLEPHETYSVAEWVDTADQVCRAIRQAGRKILFVGGTPLYLKALLRGIFEGPPADWQLRRQLQSEAQQAGSAELHQRLSAVDPESAQRLHPHDTRRLIRALEVHAATGRPLSELQRQFAAPAERGPQRVIVLERPRDEIANRIDCRVDAMIAAGWLDEVRRLVARPQPPSHTASQAVGYRELIEHLETGTELPATIERIKTRTRQFAKRQRTWFRSLSECRFLPVDDAAGANQVAQAAVQLGADRPG